MRNFNRHPVSPCRDIIQNTIENIRHLARDDRKLQIGLRRGSRDSKFTALKLAFFLLKIITLVQDNFLKSE